MSVRTKIAVLAPLAALSLAALAGTAAADTPDTPDRHGGMPKTDVHVMAHGNRVCEATTGFVRLALT